MARPQPKDPQSPAECKELKSCFQVLCELIEEYNNRFISGGVKKIELGEESTEFAVVSTAALRTRMQEMQAMCGTAETAMLIGQGNYSCASPVYCEPGRPTRYGC